MTKILFIILIGWLLGAFLRGTTIEAQNVYLIQAIDSVSGKPVNIQTDGAGALTVVAQ